MKTSLAKKLFAVGSSVAMIAAAVPFIASAAVHGAGTNVLSNGTVYFINASGQKQPYTSAGAFVSYGFNSWTNVVPATPEDLALPTGSFVPPMDGSVINDNGTVFLITNGQRAGFTTSAVFLGLGYSWSNVVKGDTSFMTTASPISSTAMAHPVGTLVNDHGTVFLMTASGKMGIPSLPVFNSWGYSFSKVVPANSYDSAVSMSSGIMLAMVPGQLNPTGGSAGTVPPPVVTGNASVSAASDMPATTTVVAGEAAADFAHFTFYGSGTVSQVVLNRIGVSSNNAVDNVYLYQGNTRLTDGAAVSTNNTVTFTNASGLFSVNGPTTISVRADIDSVNASAGSTLGFQLASAMTGSTAVSGTPVSGNLMTIANVSNLASVVIGSGTVSPYGVLPVTGAQVNAGTTNYVFYSTPITVSQRAVQLKLAQFKYIGSASTTALQNWGLYLNGAKIATSTGVNSTGYVAFDLSGSPATMATGSNTLEVHADIIGGSNRNVELSIQNGSDLMLYDTNYNVAVTPKNSYNTTAGYFSAMPAGLVNINNGTLSISLDPSLNTTTNVPTGATNWTIGSFQMQSYGEDVQINNLTLTPAVSGGAAGATTHLGSLNNVTLYANGAQVGTNVNYTGSGTINFNLGSSLIIPAGTTVTLSVKADLVTSDNYQYTSGTVQVTLAAGSNNAQGRTSSQPVSTPVATGQSLSIGGGSGTVSVNAGLLGSTVLSNTPGTKIGSYVIQAGSAEGLRINSLLVGLTTDSGFLSGGNVVNLSGLKVVINNCGGSAYTSNPVNPSASNTFSVSCVLPINTSTTVDVYGDIQNATGNITTALTVTAQGSTSNTASTGTGFNSSVTGQLMQVLGGSLANPSLGGSAALSQLVASSVQPTQGPANTAAFNFVSAVGTTTLQELWVKVTGNTTGTEATDYPASQIVTQVTVSGPGANGTTSTASAQVSYDGTNHIALAHVTGLAILIPAGNQGVDVSVVPTYNFVGTNGIATNQRVYLATKEYKYSAGQSTVDSTPIGNGSLVYSNPMVLVASYPTVQGTNGVVGVGTGATFGPNKDVIEFSITASQSGPVRIEGIAFTPSWSGNLTHAAADNVKIYNTASSSSILNGTSGQTLALVNSTQSAVTFTTPEVVAAGTTKTYRIQVDTSGLGAAIGDSFTVSLTSTGETYAATPVVIGSLANMWAWNDATGTGLGTGSETFSNGYLVKNLTVTGPTFAK